MRSPLAEAPTLVRDGLAVRALGEGPPVLFMPGPHRAEQRGLPVADALIDGLVALGRRVITFDPPGSGHSPRPARLALGELHGCADEALGALGIAGPVAAVGHSMGGLVLLAYALERPGRLSRLVLVGTGAGGDAYLRSPGALWNRSHPAFGRMAVRALLHIAWPSLATERILMNLVSRESFHDPRHRRPLPVGLRDWFRPRRARADWHRIARRLDFTPRLGRLAVPTLLACGRHDPQFPLAASEALAAGIPGARLVVFERSGHHPFIEEPRAFFEEVGRFLSV